MRVRVTRVEAGPRRIDLQVGRTGPHQHLAHRGPGFGRDLDDNAPNAVQPIKARAHGIGHQLVEGVVPDGARGGFANP